jgi:hypothetical protein
MELDIVTKQDLLQVKTELINALKEIISSNDIKSKKWLRSSEVQEMLGISSSALQNLRVSGTIKCSKLAGVYYYDAFDLSDILERNKRK